MWCACLSCTLFKSSAISLYVLHHFVHTNNTTSEDAYIFPYIFCCLLMVDEYLCPKGDIGGCGITQTWYKRSICVYTENNLMFAFVLFLYFLHFNKNVRGSRAYKNHNLNSTRICRRRHMYLLNQNRKLTIININAHLGYIQWHLHNEIRWHK